MKPIRFNIGHLFGSGDLKYRMKFLFSELVGTAFFVGLGLSFVILMLGQGSPMQELLPDRKIRQVISGFLFGSAVSIIILSPVGKISGSHINPAFTMTMLLFKKIELRLGIAYILFQSIGAVLGSLPLLLWGKIGKSIGYGATFPRSGYTVQQAFLTEIVITFAMVLMLIVLIGFRQTRRFTPLFFPIFFAIAMPLVSDLSGASVNPARSLGPAVISGIWDGWWIYWAGPLLGALLASLAGSFLAKRITVAKLYHFDTETRGDALLRRNRNAITQKKNIDNY